MSPKKLGIAAAALAAAGAVALGGAALANAADPTTGSTVSTVATTGTPTDGTSGTGGTGKAARPGGPAGHQHTDVTGDELAKVTAAVKAKDAAVTVDSVRKDPDGSYDVHATKDGARVMFEVSADLATITQGPAGGPGGPGGPAGHQHTIVTGDELAKVTAAVKAKDAAVTVDSVRKDPDGSYDVHATKDGARVMFEVSADLATITQGPAGGPGAAGGHGGGKGPRSGAQPTGAPGGSTAPTTS